MQGLSSIESYIFWSPMNHTVFFCVCFKMHPNGLIIPSLNKIRGHFFVAQGIPISLAVGMSVIVPVRKIEHVHVLDVRMTDLSNFVRVESFDDEPTYVSIRLQCRPRTVGRHDISIQLLSQDSTGNFTYDLVLVFNAVESTIKSCIDHVYFGSESATIADVIVSPYILHSLLEDNEITVLNSNLKSAYEFECVCKEDKVQFLPKQGIVYPGKIQTVQVTTTAVNITGIIPMTICLSVCRPERTACDEMLPYKHCVATVCTPSKLRIPILHAHDSVMVASTESSHRKQVKKPSSEVYEYSLTHQHKQGDDITITLFGYLPEPALTPMDISRAIIEAITH